MNTVVLSLLLGFAYCTGSMVWSSNKEKLSMPYDVPAAEAADLLVRLEKLQDLYAELLQRNDVTRKQIDELESSLHPRSRRTTDEECCNMRNATIPGIPGFKGQDGEKGFPGDRGPMGYPGDPGLPGSAGADGEVGRPGDQGIHGRRGAKGDTGSVGPNGVAGPPGDKGLKGNFTGSGNYGVYTRWGKKACPGDSSLVYEGYAAGAAYNEQGGGADYLCLPKNPQFMNPVAGVTTRWRARIHGAEYEVVDFSPFDGMDNGDVPCAVCQVRGRSSVLMQPAKYTCPNGWTREYMGYLMASHREFYRTKWVCVDENAELTTPQSTQNLDGALFYPTEGVCHSSITGLPCTQYTTGNELTCSVCTH